MHNPNNTIGMLEHMLSIRPLKEEDIMKLPGSSDFFREPGIATDAFFILRTRGIIEYNPETKEYSLNKDYEFVGELHRKGAER
jgi:hypothetical protein